MYMIKVTITTTGTAQRIIPRGPVIDNTNTAFSCLFIQNNGSSLMYLGDSGVTTTNSLQLLPSTGVGGTPQPFPLPLEYTADLKDFWVIGTQNDVLNIMVFN